MPADVTADQPLSPAATPATATATANDASLAWTVKVVLVMVVLMALFNAASVISWANTLAPTPENQQVRQVAQTWFDTTDRLGLAAPRAALRAQWAAARKVKFIPETAPADPTSPDQR